MQITIIIANKKKLTTSTNTIRFLYHMQHWIELSFAMRNGTCEWVSYGFFFSNVQLIFDNNNFIIIDFPIFSSPLFLPLPGVKCIFLIKSMQEVVMIKCCRSGVISNCWHNVCIHIPHTSLPCFNGRVREWEQLVSTGSYMLVINKHITIIMKWKQKNFFRVCISLRVEFFYSVCLSRIVAEHVKQFM